MPATSSSSYNGTSAGVALRDRWRRTPTQSGWSTMSASASFVADDPDRLGPGEFAEHPFPTFSGE